MAVPSAEGEVFFDVYKSSHAGIGWRWGLWRQAGAARVLLAAISGPMLDSEEACDADLAAFKKLVANSPTRRQT